MKSKTVYKGIGFDYGGVIAGRTGSAFARDICDLLGVSFDQYKEVYYRHNQKINVEGLSWPEFWKLFANDIGYPEKYDDIMKISNDYAAALHRTNPEILELAHQLKSIGYKVGLLSNNTKENGQILRKLGVDKHFDVFHISAEKGHMKPSVEAFELFAKDLDVEMSELIFIDDSPKSLQTADQCGFTPILFKSYDELVAQLKALEIL